MNKIIKSTILEDLAQAPGCGRDVRERHEWDDGAVTEVYYRCADKVDARKLMALRVPALEQQRAASEAAQMEQEAMEAKRIAALKRLPVADVADVLMVSDAEAQKMKTDAEVMARMEADADTIAEREMTRG